MLSREVPTKISSLTTEVYTKKWLHPSRGVAPSGFRPLRKIPHCCLPYEYGPCLSSILAGRSLKPATRHRLGKPLPHQLSDRPQAPPEPKNLYPAPFCSLAEIRFFNSAMPFP